MFAPAGVGFAFQHIAIGAHDDLIDPPLTIFLALRFAMAIPLPAVRALVRPGPVDVWRRSVISLRGDGICRWRHQIPRRRLFASFDDDRPARRAGEQGGNQEWITHGFRG